MRVNLMAAVMALCAGVGVAGAATAPAGPPPAVAPPVDPQVAAAQKENADLRRELSIVQAELRLATIGCVVTSAPQGASR